MPRKAVKKDQSEADKGAGTEVIDSSSMNKVIKKETRGRKKKDPSESKVEKKTRKNVKEPEQSDPNLKTLESDTEVTADLVQSSSEEDLAEIRINLRDTAEKTVEMNAKKITELQIGYELEGSNYKEILDKLISIKSPSMSKDEVDTMNKIICDLNMILDNERTISIKNNKDRIAEDKRQEELIRALHVIFTDVLYNINKDDKAERDSKNYKLVVDLYASLHVLVKDYDAYYHACNVYSDLSDNLEKKCEEFTKIRENYINDIKNVNPEENIARICKFCFDISSVNTEASNCNINILQLMVKKIHMDKQRKKILTMLSKLMGNFEM